MRTSQSPYSGVICLIVFIALCVFPQTARTQEPEPGPKETVEPIFRVPKIGPGSDSESTGDTATVAERSLPVEAIQQPTPESESKTGPAVRVADARGNEIASLEPASLPDKKSAPISPRIDLTQNIVDSHPLDRAIEIARSGLDHMRSNIHDYTAILVKRERVGNKLGEAEYMRIKIRNPRTIGDQKVPFSVYMKFIKPRGVAGREIVWVDGRNNNNLIAHEPTPLVRFRNFHLDPNGFMAMKDNKYPIYDAGLENLVLKLIDKAERDRDAGVCEVRYLDGAAINRRPCTLIEVEHAKNCAPYEFHLAKVYIDNEMNLPVGFAAYDWPIAGNQPGIMEEYTYINVKLNVGLTDKDFDIANPVYDFAK